MHGCTNSSSCIILKSMTSTSHSAVHSSPCVHVLVPAGCQGKEQLVSKLYIYVCMLCA